MALNDSELEAMYKDVMDDPAVAFLSNWREPNNDDEFNEVSFLAHVETFSDSFLGQVEKALEGVVNGR